MVGEERKLDFREREIVLRADFDELDDEQRLAISVRFLVQGPRHPRAGEWVYLLDHRGCGCLGYVESIDGWLARVKPDWGSWSGGEKPPLEASHRAASPPPVGDSQALGPGMPS